MPRWRARIAELAGQRPTAREDEIGWLLVEELSRAAAALLEPVFDAEGGRNGRLSVQTDPRHHRNPAALVEQAVTQAGGLDIALANAGVSGGLASLFEQSVDDWTEILRVNLLGPFLMVKHAAEPIRARGGGSIRRR